MRAAGFDGIKTQLIVKALFTSSSMSERERERHMELAFDVWDEHHRGVLQLDEFERDLHLMFDDTFSAEEQQTVLDGLAVDGSGEIDYEHFRELMQTLGSRRRRGSGTIDSLRAYAEDVALAVRTLGGEQSAQLRRKDLRLAGQLVRALQLHGFEDARATALLRPLVLLSPTDAEVGAALAVLNSSPVKGGWPPASEGAARAQLEAVLPDAAHAAMHVEHSAWAERNSLNNTLEPSRLAALCGELREAERQRAAAEKSGDDSEQSWVGEAPAALLERAGAAHPPRPPAARLLGDLRAGRLVRASRPCRIRGGCRRRRHRRLRLAGGRCAPRCLRCHVRREAHAAAAAQGPAPPRHRRLASPRRGLEGAPSHRTRCCRRGRIRRIPCLHRSVPRDVGGIRRLWRLRRARRRR